MPGRFCYLVLLKNNRPQRQSSEPGSTITDTQTTNAGSLERETDQAGKQLVDDSTLYRRRSDKKQVETNTSEVPEDKTSDPLTFDTAASKSEASVDTTLPDEVIAKYKLAAKRAYFHNQPDQSTRRKAFIVQGNNAVIEALDEENGFIYVIYTNHLGQTSKGWLNKKDLVLVTD